MFWVGVLAGLRWLVWWLAGLVGWIGGSLCFLGWSFGPPAVALVAGLAVARPWRLADFLGWSFGGAMDGGTSLQWNSRLKGRLRLIPAMI